MCAGLACSTTAQTQLSGRALLDRLRAYEALLRGINIPFDQLQPAPDKDLPDTILGGDSHDGREKR